MEASSVRIVPKGVPLMLSMHMRAKPCRDAQHHVSSMGSNTASYVIRWVRALSPVLRRVNLSGAGSLARKSRAPAHARGMLHNP